VVLPVSHVVTGRDRSWILCHDPSEEAKDLLQCERRLVTTRNRLQAVSEPMRGSTSDESNTRT